MKLYIEPYYETAKADNAELIRQYDELLKAAEDMTADELVLASAEIRYLYIRINCYRQPWLFSDPSGRHSFLRAYGLEWSAFNPYIQEGCMSAESAKTVRDLIEVADVPETAVVRYVQNTLKVRDAKAQGVLAETVTSRRTQLLKFLTMAYTLRANIRCEL